LALISRRRLDGHTDDVMDEQRRRASLGERHREPEQQSIDHEAQHPRVARIVGFTVLRRIAIRPRLHDGAIVQPNDIDAYAGPAAMHEQLAALEEDEPFVFHFARHETARELRELVAGERAVVRNPHARCGHRSRLPRISRRA
jgi:hypothetical protein